MSRKNSFHRFTDILEPTTSVICIVLYNQNFFFLVVIVVFNKHNKEK